MPTRCERCHADIARGDIVIATMLFMEDHIRAVLPRCRRAATHCDAMVCCMSAGEVMQADARSAASTWTAAERARWRC